MILYPCERHFAASPLGPVRARAARFSHPHAAAQAKVEIKIKSEIPSEVVVSMDIRKNLPQKVVVSMDTIFNLIPHLSLAPPPRV